MTGEEALLIRAVDRLPGGMCGEAGLQSVVELNIRVVAMLAFASPDVYELAGRGAVMVISSLQNLAGPQPGIRFLNHLEAEND